MRKSLAIASLLLLTTASPLLSYEVDEPLGPLPQNIQRRQDAFTIVTGITEFGIQPRLEIRELEQYTDQWNIYLLGLVRFHQSDQTDKLSYYQIAGKPMESTPDAPYD